MDGDQLKGKWMQLKGGLKQRWGKLTSDDVQQIDGSAGTFIGRCQEQLGETHDGLTKGADPWDQKSTLEAWGSSPTEWMRFTRDN